MVVELGFTEAKSGDFLKNGLRWLMGNGRPIKFWEDVWLLDTPIAVAHPRLYRIATQKSISVHDCGFMNNRIWYWDLVWRGALCSSETPLLSDLTTILAGIFPTASKEDKLIWSHDKNGVFNTKGLFSLMENTAFEIPRNLLDFKVIWNTFIPSKISIFMWRCLYNKLPSKFNLHSRGIIPSVEEASCPACGDPLEDIDHAILKCPFARKVSLAILSWWDAQSPLSSSISNIAMHWDSILVLRQNRIIWFSVFFVTAWLIWWRRNSLIFREKWIETSYLVDSIKVKCFELIKVNLRNASFSSSDWFQFPLLVCNAVGKKPQVSKFFRPNHRWLPPTFGSFKFNVDGLVVGKPCHSGIGGVLRDSNGYVKAIFSKNYDIQDSNFVELLAIIFAAELFSNSSFKDSLLVIESYSKNAITWVLHHNKRPWSWWKSFLKLEAASSSLPYVDYKLIRRLRNSFADSLAKSGVSRDHTLVAWL